MTLIKIALNKHRRIEEIGRFLYRELPRAPYAEVRYLKSAFKQEDPRIAAEVLKRALKGSGKIKKLREFVTNLK